MSNKMLLDSSALNAIVSSSDDHHSLAVPFFEILLDRATELYISSYTLFDFINTLHDRAGFPLLVKILGIIESITEVVWTDKALHQQAWNEMKTRNGNGPSFLDWINIIVAKNLNAPLFTFNRQLGSEGIILMPRNILGN